MSTLQISQLSKSFNSDIILDQLNLKVNEGEFVSLLGPSGSGKSTIFHLIGGLYTPDNGKITLNEKDITGQKGSISYMPQSPSLFPWRTVLENVVLAQELFEKPDKQKAIKMLERAGLGEYINRYPAQLSGGMRQRAAFVRSLLSPQSMICLDEPFSALDEFTRLDMQKWLLSIWEEERPSVLFVTHNIEEAIYLSDRVLILGVRPASVIQEITIPFERPRTESLTLTPDFLQIKKSIFQTLRGIDND
ncbi:ABC-type nitrate/sulfonate/bicarbonate transport system, ATPase component [Gracilibacillus ureilyticus]|uniref:ABC-type nitrate/sulfonate/bicarbonate transport system, ATPase component n=1 Tax=Gracilibacillus ureilyticus TaxID=531814 RepID=A0A1H9P5L3_9BACI|nr:ABC transporter ATP-binding protein [Gracilibacillus ureilyticus]SER43584.1 ABC-type nitrate/sulfonate/bicarbonate transport system, ATPase component [Gracilibacillus ureilyticus]